MAGSRNKEILKEQALRALDESRLSLQAGVHHAREQLNPRSLAQHAVRKHGLLLVAGAVAGGFLLTRMLFSKGKQNSRDTSGKSATKKRTIAGIVLTSAWGLAREPLLALAAQKLMPLAMQYIDKIPSIPARKNPPSKPDFTE